SVSLWALNQSSFRLTCHPQLSLDGVRTRRWCPARPLPCMLENGANEWVLAAHVGDIVVTKPPRELMLQRSILRRATWVCTEIVTKRKLVGDFDVADRTRVSMMRPPPVLVLAEIEAPRCTWNLRIQALSADAIAKGLHG